MRTNAENAPKMLHFLVIVYGNIPESYPFLGKKAIDLMKISGHPVLRSLLKCCLAEKRKELRPCIKITVKQNNDIVIDIFSGINMSTQPY